MFRSIFGTYEGDGEYRGIQGHKYVFSLGDTRKNRKDSCYCLRDDACPKKGAIDLMKCQGNYRNLNHNYYKPAV